jgi:hypothetical protein
MSISIQSGQTYQLGAVVASEQSPPASGTQLVVLLPTPSGDAQADAMSWMYLFTSKQQALDVSNGRDNINRVQQQRAEAYKQEIEAIKKAIEAASHHSFWDSVASIALTVGKVAAVVGSIAVAVGTGGAGVVGVIAVAGAVLSTAGFVEGEAHVLEKLGVDEGAATWIGIGLSIGGAACTGGAALMASSGEISEVATTVEKVSAATTGAATIAGGAAKIEAGQYKADQEDALADAAKAQMDQARMQRLILMILSELESSQGSDDKTLGALRGAVTTKGETLVSTTAMRA